VLNVTQLQNLLASGSVGVTTNGAKASNIVVSTTINWVSGSTLTLDAYHSLIANKPIVVGGTGGLAVLTNDGGSGGTFTIGKSGYISFWSLSSSLSINGNAYKLMNNISSLAADIASNAGGNYALASSYDASADGTYSSSPIPTTFSGNFEGLGNSISNLTITDTNGVGAGHDALFSQTNPGGNIEHVNLTKESVTGGSVGGLVSINEGSLFADSASGNFSGNPGNAQVGALVSTNDGTISESHSSGRVRNAYGYFAGGLVSVNNTGQIINCYSTAKVLGSRSSEIGGLAGENVGQISLSYATGSVTAGNKSSVGGLVGVNGGTIAITYATGSVADSSAKGSIGGLVGENDYVIANSYALGSVNGGVGAYVGGLVGSNGIAREPGATVSDSYSTGAVTDSSGGTLGGSVGIDNDPGDFSDTFWNTTTSGVTALNKEAGHPGNDLGITGLTTTQLQSGLPTGFSNAIWTQSSSINGGLPYLLGVPPG
jgi:hypothetical protein